MFGIPERHAIAHGSFTSTDDLREKIFPYITWRNLTNQPFHWSYRPKSWSASSA